MKTLAQSGMPAGQIARTLGRTAAATLYKARMYGVKLPEARSGSSAKNVVSPALNSTSLASIGAAQVSSAG